MEKIVIREEFIKLGQVLKAAHMVDSGMDAKHVIQDGQVYVNGQVETQRGKKLYGGEVVTFQGKSVQVEK